MWIRQVPRLRFSSPRGDISAVEVPPEEQGIELHTKLPSPEHLCQKEVSHNFWAVKTSRDYVGERLRAVRDGSTDLNMLGHKLTYSQTYLL